MLKNTVPTSWTPDAHQSSCRGSNRPLCTNWSVAADVKKIEPTKKTIPSISDPTSSTSPGNGPTRKHVEPIAKRIPIHQDAWRGAHHTLRSIVVASTIGRDAARGNRHPTRTMIGRPTSCTIAELSRGRRRHVPVARVFGLAPPDRGSALQAEAFAHRPEPPFDARR